MEADRHACLLLSPIVALHVFRQTSQRTGLRQRCLSRGCNESEIVLSTVEKMLVFLCRPQVAMKDGNTVIIRRRFDQDARITTRDRQFLTYEWLGHSFWNIEIVGTALVVSLPLCQILFAVTFHLDPSQEFIATNLRDSLYLIRKRERICCHALRSMSKGYAFGPTTGRILSCLSMR